MTRTLVIAAIVVTMLGRSAAADKAEDHRQWRAVFFGSLALTVGTGAFWSVAYASMRTEADQIVATKANGDGINQDDCNDRAGITGDADGHFDSACAWRSRSRTALLFNVGFGIVTLASIYLAFIEDDGAPQASKIAVTPTVGRDGAGAQVQLRW